jgi:hypothetical protein
MKTKAERSQERRWVVIAADGRYVTLGRHSDPSEQEILDAENALRTQGLNGWLAIMEGNPWVGLAPVLLEVRALAEPTASFAEAAAACLEAILATRSKVGG